MEEKTLAEQIEEISGQYFGTMDPKAGIWLVRKLLMKYPYHIESLLFKARMLMADGRDEDAEICIEDIKDIDCWTRIYIYDEAILRYRKDKDAGIEYMQDQLERVMHDIVSGMSNFFLGVNDNDRKCLGEKLRDVGIKALTQKWKKKITGR